MRLKELEEFQELKEIADSCYSAGMRGDTLLFLIAKVMYKRIHRLEKIEIEDLDEAMLQDLEELRLKVFRMHQDYGGPVLELIELELEEALEKLRRAIRRKKHEEEFAEEVGIEVLR